MRPYLAVVADSFRAALVSRVLWIAMIAIWILLIALALVGVREVYTADFAFRDLDNGTRLKALLAQGLVDPEMRDEPIGRLAAALPEDFQETLRQVGEGENVQVRRDRLADNLNDLLDDESWYDAAAWEDTLRLRELRDLDATPDEELSDSLRRRRARLRVEAALPGVFQARSPRSIKFTYAGFDFPSELAIDKTGFSRLINQFVVPLLIDWLLGFILIFLGILVTASIVPDMLQAGSLHLLLSKPISRTLLLLAKFLGGCAFVLLCVTQLVIGLYLIAGLRLDIWNLRFLWCIPAAVFLFSVFYSVSTLAGLKWRSPILAIGITCMFGGVCFVTGIIGGLFDELVSGPDRLRSLAVADGDLVATMRDGSLVRFDDATGNWEELLAGGMFSNQRALEPILAAGGEALVTAQASRGNNPFVGGTPEAIVIRLAGEVFPEVVGELPVSTNQLIAPDDRRLLALSTGGLFAADLPAILAKAGAGERLADEPSGDDAGGDDAGGDGPDGVTDGETDAGGDPTSAAGGGWLSSLIGLQGGGNQVFRPVLPDGVAIVQPFAMAVADDGHLLLYSRDRVTRLAPGAAAQDRYQKVAEAIIEGEPIGEVVLAVSGQLLLVGRSEQPLRFLDLETLEPVADFPLAASIDPTDAVGLGDAKRFVVLMTDGTAHVITVDGGPELTARRSSILSLTNVETLGVDFDRQRLLVGHDVDRVTAFDLDSLAPERIIDPELSVWRKVDRYVLAPLRFIIPQTGELGETVASMISGKSGVMIATGAEQSPEVVRYEIVRPIASCTIFILIMMSIACVYFARSDF